MNKVSNSNSNNRRFGISKNISQIIDVRPILPQIEVPVTPCNSPTVVVEPVVEPVVTTVIKEPIRSLKRENSTVKRQAREEFLARFKK